MCDGSDGDGGAAGRRASELERLRRVVEAERDGAGGAPTSESPAPPPPGPDEPIPGDLIALPGQGIRRVRRRPRP